MSLFKPRKKLEPPKPYDIIPEQEQGEYIDEGEEYQEDIADEFANPNNLQSINPNNPYSNPPEMMAPQQSTRERMSRLPPPPSRLRPQIKQPEVNYVEVPVNIADNQNQQLWNYENNRMLREMLKSL